MTQEDDKDQNPAAADRRQAVTAPQEEQGFLPAIVQAPDDDAPRLIYADWLDEHDNGTNGYADRAEFIRLQCGLAGLPKDDPHRQLLENRAQELLDQHRDEWTHALCDAAPLLDAHDIEFARGFPDSAVLYHVESLDQAAALRARAPLQSLVLDLRNTDNYCLGEAGAQALAQHPSLRYVTHLFLHGNDIGDAGAQALATSPYVEHLTQLDLTSNYIRNAGAHALAASEYLHGLVRLQMDWNDIRRSGALALCRSSHLPALTHLHLNGNPISEQLLDEIWCEMKRRRAPPLRQGRSR